MFYEVAFPCHTAGVSHSSYSLCHTYWPSNNIFLGHMLSGRQFAEYLNVYCLFKVHCGNKVIALLSFLSNAPIFTRLCTVESDVNKIINRAYLYLQS